MLRPASVGTRELTEEKRGRLAQDRSRAQAPQSNGGARPTCGRQPSTSRQGERTLSHLIHIITNNLREANSGSWQSHLTGVEHCVDIYPRGSSAVSTIWGTMHRGTDPTKNLEGEGDGSSSWDPPYILKPSRALKLAWLAGKRLRRNLLYSGFGGLLDALIGRLITAFTAGIQDLPNPEAEPDLEGGGDEEDH
jgi:hypothetical protein